MINIPRTLSLEAWVTYDPTHCDSITETNNLFTRIATSTRSALIEKTTLSGRSETRRGYKIRHSSQLRRKGIWREDEEWRCECGHLASSQMDSLGQRRGYRVHREGQAASMWEQVAERV